MSITYGETNSHTFVFELVDFAKNVIGCGLSVYKHNTPTKTTLSLSYSPLGPWLDFPHQLTTCMQIVERRFHRPTWICPQPQRYAELAAYVDDQSTLNSTLEWVGTYDRDALQKFIADHKCNVMIPAMPVGNTPSSHVFIFSNPDMQTKCTVLLERIDGKVFMKSAEVISDHESSNNIIQMCLCMLRGDPNLSYDSPKTNIIIWLKMATWIGSVETYKKIAKWVQGDHAHVDELREFASECKVDALIKHFAPQTHTLKIATPEWSINATLTYQCNKFEFSFVISGNMNEADLGSVNKCIHWIKASTDRSIDVVLKELQLCAPVERNDIAALYQFIAACRL
jgi:hypothetical protein